MLITSLIVLIVLIYAMDVVYESHILSLAGHLVATILLVLLIDLPPDEMLLVLPLLFVGSVSIQYAVWRRWVVPKVAERLAPTKYDATITRLRGERAVVVEIDGRNLASVHDELWPLDGTHSPGTELRINNVRNGKLVVTPLRE